MPASGPKTGVHFSVTGDLSKKCGIVQIDGTISIPREYGRQVEPEPIDVHL